MVHSLLEGATAYVGFDVQKESIENYFLCDGVADDVQIQAAVDYIGNAGGEVCLEPGTYDITTSIDLVNLWFTTIRGQSWYNVILRLTN